MDKSTHKKGTNSRAQQKAETSAEAFVTNSSFSRDPYGCYTGNPKDDDKVPTQDADDL